MAMLRRKYGGCADHGRQKRNIPESLTRHQRGAKWPADSALTRHANTARQTQNMGDRSAPSPICGSGEPPGTRTLNPLIKSQLGAEMIA